MNNVVELPLSKDKLSKLLIILIKKKQRMGLNPALKDWFEIQNKIKAVKRSLNATHD